MAVREASAPHPSSAVDGFILLARLASVPEHAAASWLHGLSYVLNQKPARIVS